MASATQDAMVLASSVQQQRPKIRLQSGTVKPLLCTDGTIRYGCFSSIGEPKNLQEAPQDTN